MRGYDTALSDPALGQRLLESQVPGSTTRSTAPNWRCCARRSLAPSGRFGVLDLPLLRTWARWEARFGIVRQVPDVTTMFDTAYAPR